MLTNMQVVFMWIIHRNVFLFLVSIRPCGESNGNLWEFRWENIRPKELGQTCRFKKLLSSTCIVNALINIDPSSVVQVAGTNLPGINYHVNGSCASDALGLRFGDTEDMLSYTMRPHKCVYFDITYDARNAKISQTELSPIVVLKFKKNIPKEEIENFLPFITIELASSKGKANCRSAVRNRQYIYQFNVLSKLGI